MAAPLTAPTAVPARRELLRRLRLLAGRVRRPEVSGAYRSALRGAGIDFAELRPYALGDDVRALDYNAWARTRRPHVRVFTEERAIRVALALDLSASMGAPGLGRPKLEVASDVCLALALAALDGGDRVGWLTFSDRTHERAAPRGGRHALRHLLLHLAAPAAATVAADYPAVVAQLAGWLRRRSVVALVSDFLLDPERDDGRRLRADLLALARRHELLVIAINDPLEWELPAAGLVWVARAPGDEPVLLDSSSASQRDEYRRRGRAIRAFRRHLWRGLPLDVLELSTADDPLLPLVRFLRQRAPGRT